MMGNIACQGALCVCNQAIFPTPIPLTVTSQMSSKVNGIPVATIMDNKPIANIKPFNGCKILKGPCVPAVVAPWGPGSLVRKVNNQPVLTANSKLVCTVGGQISIASPNCTANVKTK